MGQQRTFSQCPQLLHAPARTGGPTAGHLHSDGEYVRICEDPLVCHTNPSRKRDTVLLAVFVALWAAPMALLYELLGIQLFFTEGLFFTKAAFLTFGGAYAVLAYIAQAGVEQ